MSIPAYYKAKADRALRGAPIIIYLDLLETLTVGYFRPVPQLALCVKLGYSERAIRASLRLLTRRGFLRHRTGPSNGPREYQLEYDQRAPRGRRRGRAPRGRVIG